MKKTILLIGALVYLTGCSSVETKGKGVPTPLSIEKEEIKTQNITYEVLEIFDHEVPEGVKLLPKYHKHPEILNYVLVKTAIGNIREFPVVSSKVIEKGNFNKKFKALEKVSYQGNIWYKVQLSGNRVGYISSQIVEYRAFRFEHALKGIESALDFVKVGNEAGKKLAVVDTYRPDPNNRNQKRERDKYGTTEDQSLVGFNNQGEKIFIPDRSVVKILEKDGGKVKVRASSIPEDYLIVDEKKLSSTRNLSDSSINKAVVIDTSNQNKMIFEKVDGEWSLISYVYSKTGLESELGYETPKGHFIAAVSKSRMYYNDALGKEQGYAKDATRFSGGGYLHSTPLDKSELGNREYFLAQKETSLGTYPGTRKCVRTTEEHAKFIRQWVMGDHYNPRLGEQVIKDNVLFVVL